MIASDPVFLFVGVSNCDKGIDLIQNAILWLLRRHPNIPCRFVIQWANKAVDYGGHEVFVQDVLRNSPQVELIEQHIGDKEYGNLFHRADFLLLPYRRQAYFNRLSGVAVEAACAGLPMIVTENTWLSWAMEEFGAGVTVKDGDFEDLARQIEFCITHRAELRLHAQQRRIVAMEKNSSEAYIKCVWE